MINIQNLNKFFTDFFSKDTIQKAQKKDPYLANGMQLQGKERISKIVLGVSATEQFLQEAVRAGADSIIVHHGLSLRHAYFLINRSLYKRLRVLIKNDISLFGFHFLLDSHPRIGNNAQIVQRLGAKLGAPLFDEWGWTAFFEKAVSRKLLADRCAKIFTHDVFVINGEKEMIKRIGVVSGGAYPRDKELHEVIEADLDCYLTGEASESTVGVFRELGINYFACGHYATEVFGVQALGLEIKKHFKDKVEVEFIDIPNPL